MPCFLLCTFRDLVGFTNLSVKTNKINFLTKYNACGRDASVVAWLLYCLFLFSGSCFMLKPLKMHFLISCLCRIKIRSLCRSCYPHNAASISLVIVTCGVCFVVLMKLGFFRSHYITVRVSELDLLTFIAGWCLWSASVVLVF